MPCEYCHTPSRSGKTLMIPRASFCMQCHQTIATDNPGVQKLAQYAKTDRTIPWARIYESPSFVGFTTRFICSKALLARSVMDKLRSECDCTKNPTYPCNLRQLPSRKAGEHRLQHLSYAGAVMNAGTSDCPPLPAQRFKTPPIRRTCEIHDEIAFGGCDSLPAIPAAHAQNNGATLFQSNCQMCHGADGKG